MKPINQRAVDIGVAKLENCLADVYIWMSQNKLKTECRQKKSGYGNG